MEWREIMIQLEANLEQLARHGVNHLNIPRDEPLAEALRFLLSEERLNKPAPAEITDPIPPPVRPAAVADLPGGAETVKSTPDRQPDPQSGVGPAPPPPPSSINSLESLSFQFRDCLACKLGKTRNRLVFGTGSSSPRLLFIGEGPGAEEDIQGLPFVGKAGGLLTGLILALGLTRKDVYITNVVKCRPPANRNPAPDEITACSPILTRQIELLNPALIVTLGNVPLKAINPAAGGITKERGKIFQFDSRPVLPTFHPSYLLRNPGAIKECWQDFKLAFQRVYPENKS